MWNRGPAPELELPGFSYIERYCPLLQPPLAVVGYGILAASESGAGAGPKDYAGEVCNGHILGVLGAELMENGQPGHRAAGVTNRVQNQSQAANSGDVGDAAILRQALQVEIDRIPPVSAGPPALVALCGLPGTGKSYFAAALAHRIPSLILGSDRLRKILVPQPCYTRDEHSRVFIAAHCLIEQLLTEGRRVIFDATNLTERARQPLYDIADRTGAQLLLVHFDAPLPLIRQRLEQRAAGLSADSYSDADWRVYCLLRPGAEPVERSHFKVDSARDITRTLEGIVGLIGAPPDTLRPGLGTT